MICSDILVNSYFYIHNANLSTRLQHSTGMYTAYMIIWRC